MQKVLRGRDPVTVGGLQAVLGWLAAVSLQGWRCDYNQLSDPRWIKDLRSSKYHGVHKVQPFKGLTSMRAASTSEDVLFGFSINAIGSVCRAGSIAIVMAVALQ